MLGKHFVHVSVFIDHGVLDSLVFASQLSNVRHFWFLHFCWMRSMNHTCLFWIEARVGLEENGTHQQELLPEAFGSFTRQGTARKGPVSAEAKSDDESSQFRNNEYLIQKVCRVSKLGGEHKQISTLQCIYQIIIYIYYHTFFVFDFKINHTILVGFTFLSLSRLHVPPRSTRIEPQEWTWKNTASENT